MPVKDCVTGSPNCPDDKYEEFHGSNHDGFPKHIFAKYKGEHKNKFTIFAENVQLLKNRTQHHM